MPSHTRPTNSSINKPQLSPFQKKQKMSLTQTYYLAHTARAKLSKEAARADHDLRLLVGHANLLDGLMIDLADAEREQESWFNSTVAKAQNSTTSSEPKHIQWSDSLPTVSEGYDEDSESSDSDSDDEISYSTAAPLRRIKSPPAQFSITEEAIEEDDDEDNEDLQLVRTHSRSSPPELLHEHDSESDSDDDVMPPSPPQLDIPFDAFTAKQRELARSGKNQSIEISHSSSQEEAFYEDGFYLPQRQQVAAF